MSTRYVVVENTPGYLPEDDDPATFDNIDEARVYASDVLSRLLDHIAEGWEAIGEETEDEPHAFIVNGSFAQENTSVLVYDCSRKHDLGRVIEIIETEDEQV